MIIVPPASSQASPAAQELGQKITNLIREYQQSHPGLPPTDIRQALRIAHRNSDAGTDRRTILVLAIGLIALAGFLMMFLSSRSDAGGSISPMINVFIGVFLLVMLVVFVVSRR